VVHSDLVRLIFSLSNMIKNIPQTLLLTGILVGQNIVYVYAADHLQVEINRTAAMVNEDSVQITEYPAVFFERYRPNTALDMINQIPGFQIDDGDITRGFGGAAGNVLINDRRPSTKQDLLSSYLARIPASQIQAIEIIRGQVRDINLQGQPVVANVILNTVTQVAVRWDASMEYNFDFGTTLESNISVSNQLAQVAYNAGFSGRHFSRGDLTPQDVFDGSGDLTEQRFDDNDVDGYLGNGNLNASGWLADTFFRFNSRFGGEKRNELRISERTPIESGALPREEVYVVDYDLLEIELGVDAEKVLHNNLLGKGILLFIKSDQNQDSTQQSLNNNRIQTRSRNADSGTITTETIARLEFDWTGFPDHVFQLNLEAALNALDNSLIQTVDDGAGPVKVDVAGANSKIEEIRGDLLLKDIWTMGLFELDYGLGAEISTISQSGDVAQERNFFYLKPQGVLKYSPVQGKQTRLRLAREVSQLDFNDFVSATVFEDDNLALGNPDLSPETTWILSLSHEHRFGRVGVIKLTAFHHWISGVLDLLPMTSTFAVPGNIGDGRRWGLELEGAIPLEALGLVDARLGINARLQDSNVVDPVTGIERNLSIRSIGGRFFPIAFRDENRYAVTLDFRQDFEVARVAWGWDTRLRAKRPIYKVNEIDIYSDGVEVNTFVETSRWYGLKTRLALKNILDLAETRDRTVFIGERGLSPVNFRELRDRTRGFRLNLAVSGNF